MWRDEILSLGAEMENGDAGRFEVREWSEVEAEFPRLLAALLSSESYGRGPERTPPPREHGIYLFSEGSDCLYVGRCGLTERAEKKGTGYSNFRARLADHTRPSAAHNQATFAWRLAVEAVEGQFQDLPIARAELEKDPRFREEFGIQKERVTAMDFRIVVITNAYTSYVFEPFVGSLLGTRYNVWATS